MNFVAFSENKSANLIRFALIATLLASMGSMNGRVLAQNASLNATRGEDDPSSYGVAARLYEEFLRTNKAITSAQRRDVLTKLAHEYRQIQDTPNAERVYATLIKEFENTESENYLYYAQALARNGKYSESQQAYAVYGERQKSDLKGKSLRGSTVDKSRFYKDSASYKLDYLPLNSRQADFSPMFYKKGLVFVSARKESGFLKRVFKGNQPSFLDLFFVADTAEIRHSTRVASQSRGLEADESGLKFESFSQSINSKYHEGPMTFNRLQNLVVFTRNQSREENSGKIGDGISKFNLYSAVLKANGKWDDISELPFNSDAYSCGHPAFSPDNKTLYFISDMPGGKGGTDLYSVDYKNGKWEKPVNAGPELNTAGNEMFPYLDANGNLYLASDGREGLGGLDVFFAELSNGRLKGNVENLGAPLNSDKDDFGLISNADRTLGYFSSNRKNSPEDTDLYAFRKTNKTVYLQKPTGQLLRGVVKSEATHQPVADVNVTLESEGATQTVRTGADGGYEFSLKPGSTPRLIAQKEHYATTKQAFIKPAKGAKLIQMETSLYGEGELYLIPNVSYGTGKAEIRPEAAAELNKLVPILKQNPEMKIEIRSHTDSRASDEYNLRLSESRAKAAMAYLVAQGIRANRLTAKGYGEEELLNDCGNGVNCSEQQHQKNRRTEFKVIAVR